MCSRTYFIFFEAQWYELEYRVHLVTGLLVRTAMHSCLCGLFFRMWQRRQCRLSRRSYSIPPSGPWRKTSTNTALVKILDYKTWGSHAGDFEGDVFWDVASCNLLDKGWRFGETSSFHHQCTRILLTESRRRQIPPKHGHLSASNLKRVAPRSCITSVHARKQFFRTPSVCLSNEWPTNCSACLFIYVSVSGATYVSRTPACQRPMKSARF